MRKLRVHLLPGLVQPEDLAGRTVVVIDVLRATTTIAYALAAGAERIVPCLEIAEAREIARFLPNAVLGGERGGIKIEGFQLGNSPAEYTPATVAERPVVFTTTNGTRAMLLCRRADQVLLGSFANLSALARTLQMAARVDLVCAGTDGQVSQEDVLLAGAVLDRLLHGPARDRWSIGGPALASLPPAELNDSASLALAAWQQVATSRQLAGALEASLGGRNLIEIGQAKDIEIAARVDVFDLVPEVRFDPCEVTISPGIGG